MKMEMNDKEKKECEQIKRMNGNEEEDWHFPHED